MLSKEEFRKNLWFISLSCKLGILALRVNSQNGDLELLDNKWKEIICMLYYALYALHTAYIVSRLPYLLFKAVSLSSLSVLLHFTLILGMSAIVFWHFVAFFRWPGITVVCFNKAFETWECEHAGPAKPGKCLLDRIKRWTLQELLAVAYPICVAASLVLMLAVYCVYQDLSSLIYSSLPGNFKSCLWFALCMLQEANQLIYSMFSVSFIFQLHILLPGTLSRILKILAESSKSCRGSGGELLEIIRHVRVIQLLVSLFNVGHRNIVYCIKLMCIVAATVTGYGPIKHGRENMTFFLLASCLTCDVIFLYAFVYEKAFAIPEGFKSVKRILTVRTKELRIAKPKQILRGWIQSTPVVGLKVGDFHMLERVSTPVFVDYVIKNIVNLLVTL